jgi:hypothetical protein
MGLDLNIDIARTNRFLVGVFPPSGVGSFRSMYVESVDMPNMSIATEDYELDGKPTIKIPYKRNPSGTVTLGIRLEESGKSRNIFKEWMDRIIVSNDNVNYYRDYFQNIVGSVVIKQLDLSDKVKFGVTLINAYPINVDTIQYDWGDNNNYVKQSVTLCYFDEQIGSY